VDLGRSDPTQSWARLFKGWAVLMRPSPDTKTLQSLSQLGQGTSDEGGGGDAKSAVWSDRRRGSPTTRTNWRRLVDGRRRCGRRWEHGEVAVEATTARDPSPFTLTSNCRSRSSRTRRIAGLREVGDEIWAPSRCWILRGDGAR